MPSTMRCFLSILLLCPSWTFATIIHRCEAASGHVTFTTMSCAADESLSLQDVRTFTPGSATNALMPEAEQHKPSVTPARQSDPIAVGKSEDRCGNMITASERRKAIINQRIIAGMSQQDVESAFGKPDKISIRNSSTKYSYESKRGRTAQIEFDEKGCTKGKAKSKTAKSPH
ncbi:cell envelope protein SmpA [Pseudomonas sp. NPDC089569]|uniref:cell envelope protein SmpA n=1 Tax=Pseudomonas sp. NPDC089569 TaxID=3390722 RepID=UPI003CFE8650